MADIQHDQAQAVYRPALSRIVARFWWLPRGLFRHRHTRIYRSELSPHIARDLGLTDVMEKPVLSPGIIDKAPRF